MEHIKTIRKNNYAYVSMKWHFSHLSVSHVRKNKKVKENKQGHEIGSFSITKSVMGCSLVSQSFAAW